MSVAFRRESDEEHLEPRFERPLPPGPNPVTPRGLRLLDERVAELEAAVVAAAVPDRDALRRELRYWHTRRATAVLAPPPARDVAGIGSSVRVRLNGTERTVEIVGTDEADPATGRVGFQAPLAKALIGGEAGERIDFGGIEEAIEIMEVRIGNKSNNSSFI